MPERTPEAREALDAADRRYTAAWHKAVRASDAEPDLAAAMAAYNSLMPPAYARWQDEVADAVEMAQAS